ncbi:hypothetical protein KP509_13G047000 [Ceratopteris richardii]|uniref:DUF4378 domain-containing protein n=2 Tax=Ceratopteris richardii TaxID=49495 RepID=A0A8T2TFB7_CERRI|nr:hypothetical protein KP509_13G047000 [Ceratopteris richardii]
MAREVLYRRSFHLGSDVREIEKLLELDQSSSVWRGPADFKTPTDDGFEAPRNSLDVPFNGLLEARRNSEVRWEDIPIGYELSKSLTTKREDNSLDVKSIMFASEQSSLRIKESSIASMAMESDGKCQTHAPNVVARLMGLEAFPCHEDLHSSCYVPLRGPLQEGYDASLHMLCPKETNVLSLPSEYDSYNVYNEEKTGYGELSFRNHPQEHQLQEFKREFAARQALQAKEPASEDWNPKQKRDQYNRLNSQMDSEEFLDALHFLNANKDFFNKILSSPHTSFSKHLADSGGSIQSNKQGVKHHTRRKLTKSSFDCGPASPLVFSDGKKRQLLHRSGFTDKDRTMANVQRGRDDEMPGRLHSHGKAGSINKSAEKGEINQVAPTRIVVLKPNLGKNSCAQNSSSSVPAIQPDGILRFKTDCKELSKEDKLRLNSRSNGGSVKEFSKDDSKNHTYNTRAIAKHIVKHIKEDISRRSSRDITQGKESSCRRAPSQRASGLSDNFSALVDGDVSQRSIRDAGKFGSSLPNSPRLSRPDRGLESRQLSFNGRRESHSEETKNIFSSQKLQSFIIKCPRQQNKGCEVLMLGDQGPSRTESVGKELKPMKKACRSNSFKVRDSKTELPRVLSRSLSAPAATCTESRASENDPRIGYSIERATCSSKAKTWENSAFKERLLCLRESFSLSKKKGSRKVANQQCSSPLDSSELSILGQLSAESTDDNEPCDRQQSDTVSMEAPASREGDPNEAKSYAIKQEIVMKTQGTPGLTQWTSMTDLAADTASETSLDRGEQPSPVSVLEAPFPDEISSLNSTRFIQSKYCGFRGELFKFKDLPINQNEAPNLWSSLCHDHFQSSTVQLPNLQSLLESQAQSLGLHDIQCPAGASEEELTYIFHILCLSGISVNGLVMAHSLSSEHGLNRSLFERLEFYYNNKSGREACAVKENGEGPLNPLCRRLLFDIVDEVIASAVKKRLLQSWTLASNQRLLLCTGKQLVEQILVHLNYHRFVSSQAEDEALEDIASKDLLKETPWIYSQSDADSVIIDLERMLCGELIRELVHDLRRR